MPSERFPILRQWPDTGPRFIPWSMIEPHRKQAEYNHCGQTLERLAERGGLSPMELWCALNDRKCAAIYTKEITAEKADAWLRTLLGGTDG